MYQWKQPSVSARGRHGSVAGEVPTKLRKTIKIHIKTLFDNKHPFAIT